MPHDFSEVKKRLVGGLWLNTIVRAGSIRYPKRTRNKQMTMLSLTNEDELSEIYLLLSRKIIVKEGVLAWNYSLFKVMRMETEGVSAVGKSRYEKSMCTATDETKAFFPREIINLDFTSQDPQDTDGRIENELESVEETIKIQSGYVASEKEVFAMIYTTLIDSRNVISDRIVQSSDAKVVRGWLGLNLASFPSQTTDLSVKIRMVKSILDQFSSKYGLVFDMEGEAQEPTNHDTYVYCIAGIVRKR